MLERVRRSRDARFDGRIYFGITSTGIYCRPICPAAPRASSRHVRYFATAAAAHAAGFRPCLRCRPEVAPGSAAWTGTSAVVHRAVQMIQDGALDESDIPRLAARLGLGPRQLDRLFATHVGVSPLTLAQTRRLHFAKCLLEGSGLRMTEVAFAAGYGSLRRFNDAVRRAYGHSPRVLRQVLARETARPAGDGVRLILAYRPPYDWSHLSAFLQARALPGVERVGAEGYARLVRTGETHALIQVHPIPGQDALALQVYGASPSALMALTATARRMFDLSADPHQVGIDLGADRQLRPLLLRRPGVRIPGIWDPFECAVRAVLGQQISVAAARTLAVRVLQRFGEPVKPAVAGLTHLFPTARQIAAGDLADLGLTGTRLRTVRTLARAVADGRIDWHADPATVVAQLQALPGIGAWTAQYIALRALGDPDALPAADMVLRRVAGGRSGPLSVQQMQSRAESWRPWRGYAAVQLWCAAHDEPVRPVRSPQRRRT